MSFKGDEIPPCAKDPLGKGVYFIRGPVALVKEDLYRFSFVQYFDNPVVQRQADIFVNSLVDVPSTV
jgi:hypothetical protein